MPCPKFPPISREPVSVFGPELILHLISINTYTDTFWVCWTVTLRRHYSTHCAHFLPTPYSFCTKWSTSIAHLHFLLCIHWLGTELAKVSTHITPSFVLLSGLAVSGTDIQPFLTKLYPQLPACHSCFSYLFYLFVLIFQCTVTLSSSSSNDCFESFFGDVDPLKRLKDNCVWLTSLKIESRFLFICCMHSKHPIHHFPWINLQF